jgi:hypothetical protein
MEKISCFACGKNGNDNVVILYANRDEEPQICPIYFKKSFEENPEKMNRLLTHVCSCDDSWQCSDAHFREICPYMKRFVGDICIASHNEQWLSLDIAQTSAELFAYHSLFCKAGDKCQVPMCRELQQE